MAKVNKKIGLGSLSLLLCVIGLLLALITWSNGTSGEPYTIFFLVMFFIVSFILGNNFKNDLGATLGKIISLIVIILCLISFPLVYFYYMVK